MNELEGIVFTIGYQGRSAAGLVEALLEAGVERLIDVRRAPISRLPGFARKALGRVLVEHGVEYVHVQSAGNPYRAERGGLAQCLALYTSHLDAHPEVLDELEGQLAGRRAALLCFEARHDECHRSILAERLRQRNAALVLRHL